MFIMSMIDRISRTVKYWTGFGWTNDKTKAEQYKSQQDGFDAKDRANLAQPVNVNKK